MAIEPCYKGLAIGSCSNPSGLAPMAIGPCYKGFAIGSCYKPSGLAPIAPCFALAHALAQGGPQINVLLSEAQNQRTQRPRKSALSWPGHRGPSSDWLSPWPHLHKKCTQLTRPSSSVILLRWNDSENSLCEAVNTVSQAFDMENKLSFFSLLVKESLRCNLTPPPRLVLLEQTWAHVFNVTYRNLTLSYNFATVNWRFCHLL
jgi:hypothetical protein